MAGAEPHKLREYLLDRLTEAEEEQVELRLLSDPDFVEEHDIVVDEITDDYIAGKFEGQPLRQVVDDYFFKSTQRRDKLRFALALTHYSKTVRQPPKVDDQLTTIVRTTQGWVFRVAVATAAVIMIVGALWFVRHRNLPPQTFATLSLTISNGERGEGDQPAVVLLPLNADALKISLRLPNSALLETAVNYRVELENDNGEVKMLQTSAVDGQSITVVIPSAELKRGQYFLKVFAVRANAAEQRLPGAYLFTVE